MGKIVGVHGIRGNIKVYSYAESAAVYKAGRKILIRRAGEFDSEYVVKGVTPHKRNVILSLNEIETREQAEMLIGADLFVEKESLPPVEPGTYYWFDIIGLDVFTTDLEYIGRVESIIPTGGNDVYVVNKIDGDEKNERLIPAIESVVKKIDLTGKTMQVDLPEGL